VALIPAAILALEERKTSRRAAALSVAEAEVAAGHETAAPAIAAS
jgi:hypothetical protein